MNSIKYVHNVYNVHMYTFKQELVTYCVTNYICWNLLSFVYYINILFYQGTIQLCKFVDYK